MSVDVFVEMPKVQDKSIGIVICTPSSRESLWPVLGRQTPKKQGRAREPLLDTPFSHGRVQTGHDFAPLSTAFGAGMDVLLLSNNY